MHTLATSYPGSVVLNVGTGTGALLVHTGRTDLHREIEISRTGAPPRTHAAVRERALPSGIRYVAVYDGLVPGEYTLWADTDTPAGTVTVVAGTVTDYHWPAPH